VHVTDKADQELLFSGKIPTGPVLRVLLAGDPNPIDQSSFA
jgi:hypothetical protein